MNEIVGAVIFVAVVIAIIVLKVREFIKGIKYKRLLRMQAGSAQKITPEINEAYISFWQNRMGERKTNYTFNGGRIQIERDGVLFYLDEDMANLVKDMCSNENIDAAVYMLKTRMKFTFNESELIVNMIRKHIR